MPMNLKLITIFSALLIIFISIFGCASVQQPTDDTKYKSDFNFIFRYGVTMRNELNTFAGTYVKDMVMDPPVITKLCLSEEEGNTIYQKMAEIDFFDYPDQFVVQVPLGQSRGWVTPCCIYYFKVECDSKVKELWWGDCITNKDEKVDKLRELIKLIISIIESKEEYKRLPPAKGGYI